MTHKLTSMCLESEACAREERPNDGQRQLAALMGLFPEGHKVRLCAERCELLLARIAKETPLTGKDDEQLLRAVRSKVAVSDSVLDMSIGDAIADIIDPAHRDRHTPAPVTARRIAAAQSAMYHPGPRARVRRPAGRF